MTDKQIIIDGVDVSGCEFYFNGCCGINGYVDCTDTPNCVYKQLKRSERRCDMWENIAVDNGELALKYQGQLDKLKEERDSYLDKYFLESQKVINLKKVLIEIKEIIYFNKANRMAGGACISIEQILQKISEVEDE